MFVDAQYSWRLFPLVSVTDMAENIGKIWLSLFYLYGSTARCLSFQENNLKKVSSWSFFPLHNVGTSLSPVEFLNTATLKYIDVPHLLLQKIVAKGDESNLFTFILTVRPRFVLRRRPCYRSASIISLAPLFTNSL